MATKLAAGLVVFRRISNSVQYLLLQTSYGEKHWTPPKGHLDENENYLDAAIRETEEESGLVEHKDYEIVDKNFSIEINYPVKNKLKKVVYWLAQMKDPETQVRLSDEHIDLKWVVLSEAIDLVKYETMSSVLKQAEEYLKKGH